MPRILVTGMSGTGKSTVLRVLGVEGYRVVDTDTDDWCGWVDRADGSRDWVWRAGAMTELLESVVDEVLFVAGCKSNQGEFYSRFERVVLLSAPAEVMLARIEQRTDNPYGKSPEERALVLEHLAEVELMLRASAGPRTPTGGLGHEITCPRPRLAVRGPDLEIDTLRAG